MSGIALVLHERGFKVTGSDLKASSYVRGLEDAGIKIRIGHESSRGGGDEQVVLCKDALVSSAELNEQFLFLVLCGQRNIHDIHSVFC